MEPDAHSATGVIFYIKIGASTQCSKITFVKNLASVVRAIGVRVLRLVKLRSPGGRRPLPHVAGQVEHAERAGAGGEQADGGGLPEPRFVRVAAPRLEAVAEGPQAAVRTARAASPAPGGAPSRATSGLTLLSSPVTMTLPWASPPTATDRPAAWARGRAAGSGSDRRRTAISVSSSTRIRSASPAPSTGSAASIPRTLSPSSSSRERAASCASAAGAASCFASAT